MKGVRPRLRREQGVPVGGRSMRDGAIATSNDIIVFQCHMSA